MQQQFIGNSGSGRLRVELPEKNGNDLGSGTVPAALLVCVLKTHASVL